MAVPLFCGPAEPDGNRVATLRQAAKLIADRDLAGADAVLQGLLAQSPSDAIALNLLGFVRMQQHNTADAEQLFRSATESNPRLTGPHLNLALLYGKDRPAEAITELSRALEIDPDDGQAQQALRDIAGTSASASALAGDKDKALALMLRAHQIMPHDPALLVNTALAAMDKGLYPDGEKYLVEALGLQPDFPRARYALARAYLAENKYAPAEEQMRAYLTIKPDDATAQYGLGFILVTEQKPEEARAAFQRSLALQPRQTESLFQLGEISLQQGKPDQAAREFTEVLERDPRHAGALTEMGIMAFRSGGLNEAQSKLEKAAALAPDYYKAHYYYALTLKKLGKTDEAEREFHIATDLQKRDKPIARIAQGDQ